MNWDIVKGKWKQMTGAVREKWGELTEDEVAQMDVDRDQLVGKLQERYGWTKNEAEREVDDYFRDKV
ncbi:CsbD family protein [Paracoccus homiensis]|uniref:CsbD family protein n=1 Tax=Paracoccus homiensis TaxID=364199 RepID=UPI00398CEDEF